MKLYQRVKRADQDQPTSREKYEQKRKMTGHGFPREWRSELHLHGWLTMKRRDRCFAKCADFPNIADKSSSFFSGSKSFHGSNIKGTIKVVVMLSL